MDPDDRIMPAILLMLGFCATAPLIDVAAKLAAQTLPVGQITTFRFLVQAALMAPVCIYLGYGLKFKRLLLWRLIFRAVTLIIATYCFVAAVRVMPIADALAIVFIEPFILLILGYWIFNDDVGPRRIAASAVGFAGSLLVIQPSFSKFGFVALYPLGTAVFFAFYMLATRGLARKMSAVSMQLHTATVASVICVPLLWLADGSGIPQADPVWPEGIAWVWLIGVGVAAAAAHMMMTYALGMAPTSTLAPLHYLEIVSAATLGYLIFGDFPNALTWTGIAIIVGSGLYIIHRERVNARTPA